MIRSNLNLNVMIIRYLPENVSGVHSIHRSPEFQALLDPSAIRNSPIRRIALGLDNIFPRLRPIN
jgi:hypothetical protein